MTLAAGARLGRYEIVGALGAGGMGTVYRAHDAVLGRDVAVKVVAEHLAGDPGLRARFEREARAVAALSHPAILAIHDFGSDGDIMFAVTELLVGRTLREVVRDGALAPKEALRFALEIAEGLAAAHRQRLVHRDLKPENVFCTDDGHAKILDFGLVRLVPDQAARGPHAPTEVPDTEPGTVLGTPGYMAPEQVRGLEADARSDVFSLGCIVFEMLTGRTAFSRASAAEALAAVLRDDPPPPSKVAADAPAWLDGVVARCLQKDPGARYASAVEVLATLRQAEGEIPRAAPASAKRKRTSQPSSLAVLPFANVGGDPEVAYLAEGLTDTLIAELSRLPNLKVIARGTVFRFAADADPQRVGSDLGVAAVLCGRLRHSGDLVAVDAELIDTGGGWRLWGERYQRPLAAMLAIREEIAREIGEALRLSLSTPHRKRHAPARRVDEEAHLLYLKGRYQWSKSTIDGFRRAIEFYQAAIERDPLYSQALAGVAECYLSLGMDRYGALPPEETLPRAKAAARQAIEADAGLADPHVALGFAHLLSWEWADADRELRRGVKLEPNNAYANFQLGFLLTVRGSFDAAVELRRHALELDPLSLIYNGDLGWTYFCARRYPEAIAQCRRTLEIEPTFSQAMFWLGFSQCSGGHAHEAVATFERAVEVTHGVATMRGALASVLVPAGRAADAERMLEQLHAESRERHVPLVALVLPTIALGRADEAFVLLERARRARSSFLVGLKVYTLFDPLRADPRFDDLLTSAGFGGTTSAIPSD